MNKYVAGSFVVSLAILIVANYYSYTQMRFICDDCSTSFGFPFKIWREGGFVGVEQVLWGGLLLNILITSCVGLLLGWAVKKISALWEKLP